MTRYGGYLNGKKPFDLFLDEAASTYFVDKSNMLRELIPLMEKNEDIIENMDTMEGKDSHKFFQKLNISSYRNFEKYINHYNVIFISLNLI